MYRIPPCSKVPRTNSRISSEGIGSEPKGVIIIIIILIVVETAIATTMQRKTIRTVEIEGSGGGEGSTSTEMKYEKTELQQLLVSGSWPNRARPCNHRLSPRKRPIGLAWLISQLKCDGEKRGRTEVGSVRIRSGSVAKPSVFEVNLLAFPININIGINFL